MSEFCTFRRRDAGGSWRIVNDHDKAHMIMPPPGGDSDPPRTTCRAFRRHKRNGDDDEPLLFPSPLNVTMAALPSFSLCLKTVVGITVALYILNQKHCLPRPLAAVVSKTLFWPTLPITVCRRIGSWSTVVDDTVVMGGCPFGFANLPEHLYDEYGVRGVINMCKEYAGPASKYKQLGIKELWLPTVDHFEPSVHDLKSAVLFIKAHEQRGDRVYVHCRAGHGRSAAAVFAWLLYKDPYVYPEILNKEFCQIRDVRKTLWRQPNIKEFHSWLKREGEKKDVSQQLHRSGSDAAEQGWGRFDK